MHTTDEVCSYKRETVEALYTSTLRADFELLRRAGLRNVTAYGGALRDADIGCSVQTYTYCAQLPEGSALGALCLATRGMLQQFGADTQFKVNSLPGDHALHFAFNHKGRQLDVIMMGNQPPCIERLACHAPYGLRGIAMNETGVIVASSAYLQDKCLKTLTINSDIAPADRHYARNQAMTLKQRAAYADFKIVG